jgi:hypothetical protein
MGIESLTLRRQFRKCNTKDYLAAQSKIDKIQSMQPIHGGDAYKLFWKIAKNHIPLEIDKFLAWNIQMIPNRLQIIMDVEFDEIYQKYGRNDWGDSYDIDEDDFYDAMLERQMRSGEFVRW